MTASTVIRALSASAFLAGAMFAVSAQAGSLADQCVAAGAGAVTAKTCSCIESKASDAEKKILGQSFELNAKILKGGAMPTDAASMEAMTKGAELQAKYLPQCM